jgi:outer membrane immunogenic protein
LLFGTGGLAYGRVADSANIVGTNNLGTPFGIAGGGFGFECPPSGVCFAGSSSAIRTGWTAGSGIEWLLDQHWSTKIEYQFVDLGTETVRVTALNGAGFTPASFNAAFHDRFNVVRLGLNYRFW